MTFDQPAAHLDVYRPMRRAVERFGVRYRCVYGGSGSGKSVAVAEDMIQRAGEDGARVLTLRKVYRTCRGSTFQLYKDILRSWGRLNDVRVNNTEMTITFPGGGMIVHAGLDDTEKLKSVTGITHIWVEEATELDFPTTERDEPDLAQIDLRLRGVSPEMYPSITLSFNPVYRAKMIFAYLGVPIPQLPSHDFGVFGDVFVQHTTHIDNPFVGAGYVNAFTKLGGAMAAAYERGELVMVDEPDQVIPYSLLKTAQDLEPEGGVQHWGVDVARFGDDSSAIAKWTGNALTDIVTYDNLDTTEQVRTIATAMRKASVSPGHVGVDAVGIGAGVVDGLRGDGLDVVEIISGGKARKRRTIRDGPGEDMRFKNLRSQMWWVLREALENGRVALPYCSQDLVEDLCAPRYRISGDKTIEVEPKRGRSKAWGIYHRLGRSPDEGDAAVYGHAMRDLNMSNARDLTLTSW